MSEIPNIEHIGEYNQHFKDEAPSFKNEPRASRNCNDKVCYIILLLLILLFVGGGIYFIISADFQHLDQQFNSSSSTKQEPSSYEIENLKNGIPIIIGMIILAIVLAVIFLCLIVKFPKCMFYSMLILGALMILVLAVALFISGSIAGGAILLGILAIYLLAIYCARSKIKIGVVLLETAAKFLVAKPTVFLAPFFLIPLVFVFEIFWLASFVGITLFNGNEQGNTQSEQSSIPGIFGGIWAFLQLFFSFFFYYCLVFLIATAAAMWYYNVDGSYICTGFKRIIANHAGSFTFAAIIVAIIAMAKQKAAESSQNSSGIGACCLCLLTCFLSMLQDLVETLNHNAVIVMAVSGEGYIDSAKSTISLIYDNFLLFYLINQVSGLVEFAGLIFISAVPGIIGFFLLQATAENSDDKNFLTIGTIIIVLFGMLIGVIFMTVLGQALSCVFIFYCLDKKFVEMGYPAPQNVPEPMKKLFSELKQSSPYQNNGYENANYNNQQGYSNNNNMNNNYPGNSNPYNSSQYPNL